jgi:hypothetical protein
MKDGFKYIFYLHSIMMAVTMLPVVILQIDNQLRFDLSNQDPLNLLLQTNIETII